MVRVWNPGSWIDMPVVHESGCSAVKSLADAISATLKRWTEVGIDSLGEKWKLAFGAGWIGGALQGQRGPHPIMPKARPR